jgi:hypothetical protein
MIFRNGYNNQNQDNYYSPVSVRDNRNVNLEISYDNFDTVNLDMARKQQYGMDLRRQMEENERRKKEALEKKKREDLEEELRLKRERELIEQRQNEENKRYRPKIDLPIQKVIIEQPKVKTPQVQNENTNYIIERKNNTLSESALNYLKDRENQIDRFNERMMENLRKINNDYQSNINALRGQIDQLNCIHERNQRYKDQLCQEVYDIKDDLNNRNSQNGIDSQNLYDLIAKSSYNKQMLGQSIMNVPRRKFEIRSYVTNKKYGDDDERKGDGLTIPSYINFGRDVSTYGPRWRQNESVWWCY